MNENEKRAEALLKKLTLEQKAALCSGYDGWSTKEMSEYGIPALRTCDGPSGLRYQTEVDDFVGVHASAEMVSYPTGCAIASSYDRELAEEIGRAIGEEARMLGVGMVLGPAANIKRTPLCGRNFEYLSEDPYLTGEIAAAQIEGIQSQGVGACMKHFACNNQETWRMRVDAVVDEQALREIYLAGFECAVKKAKPCALMASYNKLNGVRATENAHILNDILRKEWGYDGFVVSDWGAVNDRVESLKAGMDLEMPGSDGITDRQLVDAVRGGRLKEETLELAVKRILARTFAYAGQEKRMDFTWEGHHELAVRAAAESAVLLKNEDGLLPLSVGQEIVYIGRFAEHPRFQGGGSACVTPFRLTNALEETRKKCHVAYCEGFRETDGCVEENLREEAVRQAQNADVAVIFAGLPDTAESECYDRKDMKLPSCQEEVIEAVCAVQKNVVVVLHCGSPVEMSWIHKVKAVLLLHTGGQGVGTAAVQLLYGDCSPSGKLAETYPLREEDNPSYISYPGDGNTAVYREGIFVGYRYYEKKKQKVLFPFGHGLSYTDFAYSNLRMDMQECGEQDTVTVQADITNTGTVYGKEAVQLYVEDGTAEESTAEQPLSGNRFQLESWAQVYVREEQGSALHPVKELKGFEKIGLAPGETGTVTFVLDRRSFAYYDAADKRWKCREGIKKIHVGASSVDLRLHGKLYLHAEKAKEAPVTMETLVSEIFVRKDREQLTLQHLAEVSGQLEDIIYGKDANSAYLREELKELPLYAIRGIYSVPQEDLDELIEKLNRL